MIAVAISGFSWSRPWLWTRVGLRDDLLGKNLFRRAEGVGSSGTGHLSSARSPSRCSESPSTYSLPSGHATVASFACATVLALAVPRLRVPLFALAALISFSHVWVGFRSPFDVLAGAVLGVGIAIALRMLAAVLRRSEPRTPRG